MDERAFKIDLKLILSKRCKIERPREWRLELMKLSTQLGKEATRGLRETFYLQSIPGLREEILEAAKDPLDEFLDESEVEW